ncbi:MAG: glycosyltransferase family 2 protein [Verrucomicrobiaceae bacterium]|nr:glycosyltransferase family 2 protein [Verrucomicrobiaceae bacterium]
MGVLIRFSNSAETLPDVLAALQNQTLQPDIILGVDSGSKDGSRALIEAVGGQIIEWPHRYEHAKVLNFGIRNLTTDLVLVISSHTVLEHPETLSRMAESMSDPRTACVSLKWDGDPFYSDAIDWRELSAKGLKFGSIYSNSMGMIRRRLWKSHPFDETLETAEDYAWAIHQLELGFTCRRLALPFHYRRSGHNRDFEFARIVFNLAKKHRLRVTWLGLRSTLTSWLKALFQRDPTEGLHRARLAAFCRVLMT